MKFLTWMTPGTSSYFLKPKNELEEQQEGENIFKGRKASAQEKGQKGTRGGCQKISFLRIFIQQNHEVRQI